MQLHMDYGKRVTEEFQRATLADLLNECTPEQVDLHRRMYPSGVPVDRLEWSITQAQNAVLANRERGTKR